MQFLPREGNCNIYWVILREIKFQLVCKCSTNAGVDYALYFIAHHLKFAELRNKNVMFKCSDQNFVKDRDKQNFFLFFKLFYSKNTFN